MNKLSDRLSSNFHIRVNLILLCVAIIVALTIIVEQVLQSVSTPTDFPLSLSLLKGLIALLSILAIGSACYLLYNQAKKAKSDSNFLVGIAGSSLLGSILLGLL